MFDQLFKKPRVMARYRDGPLAEERRRYLNHCAEQQMSRRTLRSISCYTLIFSRTLHLAKRPSKLVTRAKVDAEVDRWLRSRSRRSSARQLQVLRVDFTNH